MRRGSFGRIGRGVDERDAPVPSAEKTGGIVTPGGRQHDLCPCPLQHRMKTRNQLGVSNVGKFPRIGGAPGVQHSVNVEKMMFMRRPWLVFSDTSAQRRAYVAQRRVPVELDGLMSVRRSACVAGWSPDLSDETRSHPTLTPMELRAYPRLTSRPTTLN